MPKYFFRVLILLSILYCKITHSARILGIFSFPSISHQIVFKPLMKELANRGHEVTVITTDPEFKGKKPLENYTEIDVHNVSYPLWNNFIKVIKVNMDHYQVMTELTKVGTEIFEKQMNTKEFQEIINGRVKFNLVVSEVWSTAAIGVGLRLKAPVIQISSMPVPKNIYESYGVPTHRTMYPELPRMKMSNLTILDKIHGIIEEEIFSTIYKGGVENDLELLRKVFGENVLNADEIWKVPELLFINVHSVWVRNRPMPPNVVLIGGIHQNPVRDLPADLKDYLDASTNGVIYISFGTNFRPDNFDTDLVKTFCEAFRQMPYDVIWKWNEASMPDKPVNVKLMSWLPQSDLLRKNPFRHSKIKLFITQAGLQSTDEAITAGVPLIAFPIFADQFYNAEMYEYLKIGIKMDLASVTASNLVESITRVISDDSYRDNIKQLNATIYDQPQTALQRAVWYTEHVLRHGNANHLRSPMANASYSDYLMLDVISTALCISMVLLLCLVYLLKNVLSLFNMLRQSVHLKKE